MTLLTSTWTDDDGSGNVGTILNNSQLQTIYNNAGNSWKGVAGGRLTLTSGVPVTASDVTAATTLYYTPYLGDVIGLYDGSANWQPIQFIETSIAVPNVATQVYDVWGFNNSGTLGLELLAWTNDTTRATALALQNGIYVKSGATTRRYLGSIRTVAAGQTEDSSVRRYVWNMANRIHRPLTRIETTGTWPYTTATWRQANGSASNQVEVVIGSAEAELFLTVQGSASNTNTSVAAAVGIGEDSTTSLVGANLLGGDFNMLTIAQPAFGTSILSRLPAIGRHIYAWLEISQATGTTTWVGTGSGFVQKNGLNGWVMA